jgi:PAS domain S-box-containing protein
MKGRTIMQAKTIQVRTFGSSDKRYRILFETINDGVGAVDMDGLFTECNQSLVDMLGYSREELKNLTYQQLTPKKWHSMEAKIIKNQVVKKGHSDEYEKEYIRKDGTTIPVSIKVWLIAGEDERPEGMWKIARDITLRKKLEIELDKTMSELERSNAELEQFAYIASHDLQEPLRVVASFVQLLARKYKGKLDSDADDFINYVVEGVTRMQDMINDLLMYSRVGTRGKPFEQISCETVLDQVLANLQIAIKESDAVITRDPLPTVMGDFSQLVQLFQNLIENAIKYRGENQPHIHISAKRKKDEWVLSVRDNGIGIDPQYFERIFIIFQRLHGTEYNGTGIGLSIAKKIVERHGGQIWVKSKPGKGSIFYFSIKSKKGEET